MGCASGAVVRTWLGAWAVMFVLWLLLVGSLSAPELAGGLFSAALAATGFHLVCTRDNAAFSIRPRYIWILLTRLPWHTLADCARVLGALLLVATGKRVRGTLQRIPFDPGPPNNPYAAARRALVVAGMSLAPNVVVVRLESDALLVHQLLPVPQPAGNREWPL